MSPSDPSSRLTAVLVGSQSLLIQCAETWRQRGHDITAVVSDAHEITDWANAEGLRTLSPRADMAAELAEHPFDYLLAITHLAILSDEVLALPRRKAINFHDGPLPGYAGLYTPAWALINQEPEYGITWHEIISGVDEGDILKTRRFALAPDETSLSLNTRNYEAAIESFGELVDELAEGRERPEPQDLSKRQYFGRYDRPPAACVLDWNRPAQELEALVRALDFGAYENAVGVAKVIDGDRAFVVGSARAVEEPSGGTPGTVLSVNDGNLVVSTAEGSLELSKLTTPFGRSLDVADIGLEQGSVLSGPDAGERDLLSVSNEAFCRSESRWARHLRSLEPAQIPFARTEQLEASQGHMRHFDLVLDQCHSDGSTSADCLAATFIAYLARLSGRRRLDVSFRDPVLAHSAAPLRTIASDWVPLRVEWSQGKTLAQAVESTTTRMARARERGSWLFDVFARYPGLRTSEALSEGGGLPVHVEIARDVARVPAAPHAILTAVVSSDGTRVRLIHDDKVLAHADVAGMERQFRVVLSTLTDGGDATFERTSLLDEPERERLLHDWNATAVDYDRALCVHDDIARQAGLTPDAEALVFEDASLTYRELDTRANHLACRLRDLGIGPDKLVGVHVDRSIDMVVGLLAVLKAGGAYVPLDPGYPSERIAFMVEDSGLSVILTASSDAEGLPHREGITILSTDDPDLFLGWAQAEAPAPNGTDSSNLAYVIYTSGSTGKPKGVMVEHRNVINFFVGMDERVPHDPPGTWLAVTSLSFDISVLELLWTLARGFKVVISADQDRKARHAGADAPLRRTRSMDFGLFYFSSSADSDASDKYRLLLEGAKFGDENGFSSVWTPERHFHDFGGLFPNPSVTSAALATMTSRIRLQAGSCVLPLHHPVRVAEEWSVVDNLSGGRVAIAFASGWHPNDFLLRPQNFADAKGTMFRDMEVVKRLWRGETLAFPGPKGDDVEVSILPRPLQAELPIWITTAGNEDTYKQAGAVGANILTHLLGQSLDEVAQKIKVYRQARRDHGLDPETGIVSLMLHTYVADDDDVVRDLVRGPMKSYLGSSVSLIKHFAWAFPAFKRPGGATAPVSEVDLGSLSEEELDAILEHAFERYYETSGLMGTPDKCVAMVDRAREAGVDEIACMIDFGVPTEKAIEGLPLLNQVRELSNEGVSAAPTTETDYSLAAQIERHGVTHLQCTPSMARMMFVNDEMRTALSSIQVMLVGGEPFPIDLVRDLQSAVGGRVINMYGPTETTIWSSTHDIDPATGDVTIGRPIANTQLFIVDAFDQPVPVSVPGELLIGGDGVTRGYLGRNELTNERFIDASMNGTGQQRLYRTGDLARYRHDGQVEFLGRLDHQVKLRGYRIELGEIEARLSEHQAVQECVVIAREDTPGDQRLVAYVRGELPGGDELRAFVESRLPDFMVPAAFVVLESFPLTPNAKIDRKALPRPEEALPPRRASSEPPVEGPQRQIADIWESILKVPGVGLDDNFFDLGGHSLLLVQVQRQLRDSMEQQLPLTDLYRFPTIRSLANHLEQGADVAAPAVERSQARGERRRQSLLRRRRS